MRKLSPKLRQRMRLRYDQVALSPFEFEIFRDDLIQLIFPKDFYDIMTYVKDNWIETLRFMKVTKGGEEVRRVNMPAIHSNWSALPGDYAKILPDLIKCGFEDEFLAVCILVTWNGGTGIRFVSYDIVEQWPTLPNF
jgi:hypothetical protein